MIAKRSIVITAYKREDSLKRLLSSLSLLNNIDSTDLILSLEYGYNLNNLVYFNSFDWKFGKKIVIEHDQKLGLKNHFIWVGDQTKEYDYIVFLEDDLYVSPRMFDFVNEAYAKYAHDDTIAAISLYCPVLNEFVGCKFELINDTFDSFFLQHPYWGTIWIRDKWMHFREWLSNYKLNETLLPKQVASWKNSSFKKIYIQYLIETSKFVAFPRFSFVTNMGDIGLHNTEILNQYQTNLQIQKRNLTFADIRESLNVYDAFFELLPSVIQQLNPILKNYNFDVDLYGNKTIYNEDFVLTTRKCFKNIFSFSGNYRPIINGIYFNALGDGIYLCEKKCIISNSAYANNRLANEIQKNYVIDIKTLNRLFLVKIKKKLLKKRND